MPSRKIPSSFVLILPVPNWPFAGRWSVRSPSLLVILCLLLETLCSGPARFVPRRRPLSIFYSLLSAVHDSANSHLKGSLLVVRVVRSTEGREGGRLYRCQPYGWADRHCRSVLPVSLRRAGLSVRGCSFLVPLAYGSQSVSRGPPSQGDGPVIGSRLNLDATTTALYQGASSLSP
jgi:hypothetical protein